MGPLARGFLCSACCAFALGLPIHVLGQEQKSAPADPQQVTAISRSGLSAPELPDSPGVEWVKLQDVSSQQGSSSQPATQTTTSQPQASGAQDQKLQHPVGTAAAEAPKVNGITAAQPAGVAIAPARQRRVRTIVLKVGAIVAAGAAIGAVIALSEATPSKPPGAH